MRSLRLALAAAILLFLPSCIGFHEDWLEAKAAFPAPQKDIQGAWIGSWTSGHNGHNGKLRCIVTETAPDEYAFHYHATWARVISGGFEIDCKAVTEDGAAKFSGDMDLGKLGGEFSHQGTGSPQLLKADWKSQRGDHGTFELARPE